MKRLRLSLIWLTATALAALAVGTSGASAMAGQPMCAIDDYGNCVSGDYINGYADESNGTYYAYADGTGRTCKAVWASRNYKTWFGVTLFRYFEQVNWCYRGGYISELQRYRWAETHYGWRYDGNVNSTCNSETCTELAPSWGTIGVWTQGQFHACAPPYDWACNYRYPQVSIGVNGYGGWGSSTAG